MSDEPKGRQYSRKKPCQTCPFARATPGKDSLLKVNPLVMIGQSQGPFALPCHSDPDYRGAHDCSNLHEVSQCAGAAIYRANLKLAERMPAALHALPANAELVFASHAELLAHFTECSVEVAQAFLDRHGGAEELLKAVLSDPRVKVAVTKTGERLG